MSEMGQREKLGIRLYLKSISLLGFFIVLTFVAAGRLDYWQGWVFNGLNVLSLLITYIALRDRKDLIKERLKPGKGMKKWDKCYYLASTPMYFVMFITSVLDAGRFSRPMKVPFIVAIFGCVVYSIGQIILLWAKRANRFFHPLSGFKPTEIKRFAGMGPIDSSGIRDISAGLYTRWQHLCCSAHIGVSSRRFSFWYPCSSEHIWRTRCCMKNWTATATMREKSVFDSSHTSGDDISMIRIKSIFFSIWTGAKIVPTGAFLQLGYSFLIWLFFLNNKAH